MKSNHPDFTAPDPAVEARVNAVVGKLSLEEKIDLLGGQKERVQNGNTYGNERAGIIPLKMADASVGLHWWTTESTSYPATIGLAATWDRELASRAGAALGRDARASGVHIVLGPGVNIYRSPLCGRNFEYMGEDPYLAAQISTAFIRGLQSQGVSATIKHYAGNYQEFSRHHVSTDMDERTLREIYLPAFRAAVEEAGTGALMTAYNSINGVHCSEHGDLLLRILKGEWNFQGLVMSDWTSTYSAEGAANGGLDLEMPTAVWMNREHLLPAVRDGRVPESVIDDKVRRLVRLMVCFGWLERPQQDKTIPLRNEESAALALEVARRSCVLLKNEGGVLPVHPQKVRKIAVVGPNAAVTPIGGGGSAYNTPWRSVSILDGMRAVFGADRIVHAAGVPPEDKTAAYAASTYTTPDGQPGLLAEYFNNPDWSGEPALRRIEARLDQEKGAIPQEVASAEVSVRWRGVIRPEHTGQHSFYQWFGSPFRVQLDGEILFNVLEGPRVKPYRVVKNLEAGRSYNLEIIFRRRRLDPEVIGACFGWQYKDIERGVSDILEAAQGADVVVFCGGHSKDTEAEDRDRVFEIPSEHEVMLKALGKAHSRVVAVITAGGNVDMRGWIDGVAGLLHAWYPGQEGGRAVAEILAGVVNPSGKLPATFERALEDRSSWNCYHDSDGDKRVQLTDGIFCGYRHHDRSGVAPMFPFGFGLSYTTFSYENLRMTDSVSRGGDIRVEFDIVNTGNVAGTEVAQLYIHDCAASVPRPVKELKEFAAVTLQPGERRTVRMRLDEKALQFFSMEQKCWVAESGDFEVRVGGSAADIRLSGRFRYE